MQGIPGRLPASDRQDPGEREAREAKGLERGAPFSPRNPLQEVRLQRLSIGESIGSFFKSVGRLFGPEIDFFDDELKEYLAVLNQSLRIQNAFESDDKARDLVRRWSRGDKVFDLDTLVERFPRLRPPKLKALLIQEMRSGDFGSDDKKGVRTILKRSSPAQIRAIFDPADGGASLSDLTGLEEGTVNEVRAILAASATAAKAEPATQAEPTAEAGKATPKGPAVNWSPIRPEEKNLQGKTFAFNDLMLFVPPGAEASKENKIHLFFTANSSIGEKANDADPRLAGGFDATDWILIGLPGTWNRIGRTIKTSEILSCLDFLGRSQSITKLRMTGHSRGHKGLLRTIMGNDDPAPQDLNKAEIRTPFIPLALVDRVVILDAFFPGGQRALRGALTGGEPGKPKQRAISTDKVFIYHVIDGVDPAASDVADKKKQFRNLPNQSCLAAIGCLRLIQGAVASGSKLQALVDAISQGKTVKKSLMSDVPERIGLASATRQIYVGAAYGERRSKHQRIL